MEEILNDSVVNDELAKFEKKYNEELKHGTISTTTQFEYAYCMVRSDFSSDMKTGLVLLEDLFVKHPEGRRDYLYYMAIGHTRLKEYSEALKHAQAFLEIEPNNQQVIALEELIKKRMDIEGLKGVAKATGAALVVGGILGLGLALTMVLMRLFCFRLSVRLGSIIVGGCCILETIVTMITLAALGGGQFLEQEALYYEESMHLYNPHDVFVWLIGVCKTEADTFYASIMICMALYLPCCATMMAGAYYMKRYLLVPFIVVELARLSCITLTHVIGMMVIKKSINVGYLIGLTIAEYIAVFGDNPLAPIDPGETTPAGAFPTDHATAEWNGSGFKPVQRNTISKNLERLPPTALTMGQFNGHNMLIDDFRPLHSRYSRSWAI
uniref:Uncharacterized protein n=1 Tax=Anopheles christyi TaxID=43041 RepID=A0A182JPJ3_9DIPT